MKIRKLRKRMGTRAMNFWIEVDLKTGMVTCGWEAYAEMIKPKAKENSNADNQ